MTNKNLELGRGTMPDKEWKSIEKVSLEVGKYYEVGFFHNIYINEEPTFKHQGFLQYTEEGFLDNNKYSLRPYPNRVIELVPTPFDLTKS